ncbi:MAG: S-layer homology domain-containing protein, partial [Clostridium lundense]|nr:S-layer homology domain-containing protein [Clostridium lundense]
LTRITECYEGSVIVPVTGTGEIVIVDNTKTFNDVAKNDWYNEYVTFVTAREIFNGTGDGNFNPNGTMNRAMLAQVLYNFARGAKEGDGTVFSDVKTGDWFNAAIGWAYENKVVNGYGDRFGASDNISRQDMATILYRYAKAAGYDVSKTASLDKFSDAGSVADYASDAMRWAVGMGLIDGIDGKLAPTGNATRAQVATIMTRFVRNAK